MKKLFLALLLLWGVTSFAHAAVGNKTLRVIPYATINCPFPSTALVDGCAHSRDFTSSPGVQHSDMFGVLNVVGSGYGNRSGAVSFVQRPPWNVAGADYGVGASLLHANNAMVPGTLTPSGTYPPGCTVHAAVPTGYRLDCSLPAGVNTWTDWDLSGWFIRITHVNSSLICNNCTFAHGDTSFYQQVVADAGGGNGFFTCNNCTIDGGSVQYTNYLISGGTCTITPSCFPLGGGSADFQWASPTPGDNAIFNYSAFLNTAARVIGYGMQGDLICNFCYFAKPTGMTAHGEFSLGGSAQTNTPITGSFAQTLTVAAGLDDTIGPVPAGMAVNSAFINCTTGECGGAPVAPGTDLSSGTTYWVTSISGTPGALGSTYTFSILGPGLANHRSSYSSGVSGAISNGVPNLIRLTVGSTTGIVTGNLVTISGVLGTTEANGTWTVTVVNSTHIDLQASTFTHAYVSGGSADIKSGPIVTAYNNNIYSMNFFYSTILDTYDQIVSFNTAFSSPAQGFHGQLNSFQDNIMDHNTIIADLTSYSTAFLSNFTFNPAAGNVTLALQPCVDNLAVNATCVPNGAASTVTVGPSGTCRVGNVVAPFDQITGVLNDVASTLANVKACFDASSDPLISSFEWWTPGGNLIAGRGFANASLMTSATTWPQQAHIPQSGVSYMYSNDGFGVQNLVFTSNYVAPQGIGSICWLYNNLSPGTISYVNATVSGNVNMLRAAVDTNLNSLTSGNCFKTN